MTKVGFFILDTYDNIDKSKSRHDTPDKWDNICMDQLIEYSCRWGFDIYRINNNDPICKTIDKYYNKYAENNSTIDKFIMQPERNLVDGVWHRETLKKAVRWVRFLESDYDIGVFYDQDILIMDDSRNFLDEINDKCLYIKHEYVWCDDTDSHNFNNNKYWVKNLLLSDINRNQSLQYLSPSTGFMIANKQIIRQLLEFVEFSGFQFWKESGFANMAEYMYEVHRNRPLRPKIPSYYFNLLNDEEILMHILNKYVLDSNIVCSHPHLCCDYDVVLDTAQSKLPNDHARMLGYMDFMRLTKPIFFHAIADRNKKWIKQIYDFIKMEKFKQNDS